MCLSLLVGIENGAGGYEDQSVTPMIDWICPFWMFASFSPSVLACYEKRWDSMHDILGVRFVAVAS